MPYAPVIRGLLGGRYAARPTTGLDMLHLRVFGSLDLCRDDGGTLHSVLSQPKRSALLVYLVLARPEEFWRRDTLLALFWPEADEGHARNALNQSLYGLRRSLGTSLIETRGRQEVRIVDGAVECDALAFDARLAAGDPAGALALYRGELLEGFHISGAPSFERWLARERARYRDHSRRAVIALADDAPDPVESRRWLERAREIAPDDEGIAQRLMKVLDLHGDRSGALRAYEALAVRLERTLGVGPSPETQALAEAIRSREDARPAPARSPPAALSASRPSVSTGGKPEARPRYRRSRVLAGGAAAVALITATGWWLAAGGSSPPPIERLAVLPLANLTDDPGQEFFVQGMHDRVISELQQAGVAVVARTSVLPYDDGGQPVRVIAGELGVDAVVEGSVFRFGDSVLVDVRLVDGGTEEYLWQQSFGGELRNIAGLHRDLTRAIADEIRGAVDPMPKSASAEIRETDPRAYEAYLQGVFHMRRITRPDLDLAFEYFAAALAIDSTYAPALVGMARAWGLRTRVEPLAPHEALEKSEPFLRRALAADSTLAEAHMVLGVMQNWFAEHPDRDASEASLRRAIELNPGLAEARLLLAQLLMIVGRAEEAVEQARIGRDLDSRNPFAQVLFAQTLAFRRRYAEAIDVLEDMLRRNPGAEAGRPVLAGLYHLTGRLDDAARLTREELVARAADDVVTALDRGLREGGYARAMRLAADALAASAHDPAPEAMRIATLYLHGGEAEKALDWLEEAHRAGTARMIGVVPNWEPLHGHPRFQALARRQNLPILAGTAGN